MRCKSARCASLRGPRIPSASSSAYPPIAASGVRSSWLTIAISLLFSWLARSAARRAASAARASASCASIARFNSAVRYGSLLEKSAVSCLLGFEQGATRGELLSLHMELLLGHLQLLQSERKVLEPPSSFEGRRRELVVAYVAPEAGTRRAHAAPPIVDRGVRQNLTLVHRAGPLAGKHASFLSGSCEAAYCWQYPLPMLQGSCGTQDRSDRCLVCAV